MLTRLALQGFRNLQATEWAPRGRFELLVGANGAGKTSFIEAVYVLATTRSFRTHRLSECVAKGDSAGQQGFSISGEVESGRRTRLDLEFTQAGAKRLLNSGSSTLPEHLSVLPVISWTTASSNIFTGPPSERRRLLDQGLVASRPAALSELARFKEALVNKRKVLSGAPGDLSLWNDVLASAAWAIVKARRDFAEQLSGCAEQIIKREDLPYRGLEIRYRPSPANALSGSSAILEALERSRSEEVRLRRPLVGPHRDELLFSWQGRDLRRMVSAGERKGIALALTAARGEALEARGRQALFLLDDVDAELDRQHLGVALRAFSKAKQIFATSSRPEVWKGVPKVLTSRVSAGVLNPE